MVGGLNMNKLHLWKHVHIAAQIEMIAVLLSFLTLKKCANFILSVFHTILHLKIITFARKVSVIISSKNHNSSHTAIVAALQ